MPMNKPSVSIITVNYHSLHEIEQSLESVRRQDHGHISPEFIVVSNSPEPKEHVNRLKKRFPELRWVQMPENAGFAKGNNAGARVASGEWLFFLNPDTRLLNDAIGTMLETARQHPEIAVLGPATFDEKGQARPSVKRDVNLHRLFYTAFPFWQHLDERVSTIGPVQARQAGPVEVVNGSAMMVKAEAFTTVDGMNEAYFMYWEENDLCLRIRKMGREVWFEPRAKITHIGGTTTRKTYLPMEIEKHRSQKKFLQQHHPQMVTINRIIGIVAYTWRAAAGAITMRRSKVRQFGTLWWWYLTKYH